MSDDHIGRPTERVEDARLLRGRGNYVDDLNRDGQLHAAIFRSNVAHGTIRRIDCAAARRLPGVRAVFTAADIDGPLPHIHARTFATEAMQAFAHPVIAFDKVRYVGEPLALVIADDPATAEDALELIEAEIAAIPAGSPLFERYGSNTAFSYTCAQGDAARALQGAAYVRRERLTVHRHTGVTMEMRGVLAEWDARGGRLQVWGATKIPFALRRILADMMSLPETAIDMIEGDTGGSFGVKGDFYPEDFLVPYVARRLGRPVKWAEDRREHLLAITHARETMCDAEIGCTADGRVVALRIHAIVDTGAYFRSSTVITPRNLAQFVPGPYRIENYDARVDILLSNKTPSGTYRGPGRFEADFVRERMFDIAARDLGIDQVAFRRENLIGRTELPYAIPPVLPVPTQSELDNGDYAEVMDACLSDARWQEKRALQGQFVDGRYHGLALGCFVEGGAAGPHENARIVIENDGSASVFVGSSAVGQGLETIMTQIAAEALQMPLESIRIFHGSTTYVTSGIGSFHSRSTVMGGNAVLLAADEIVRRARAAAAELLQCPADELSYESGIFAAPLGGTLGWSDLGGAGLDYEATFENQKHTYSYGTHAAHVAVDPRTGSVEIVDYVACEDVGRIVNPLTLHGQTIGSIVQGLGGTLLEHLVYDAEGQMLAGSFADYLLPTASDFPNIRSRALELFRAPHNRLGAKGAGEGGIIPVGGVIANAVAAALADLDIQPLDLPLTPSRIWQLVEDARAKTEGAT